MTIQLVVALDHDEPAAARDCVASLSGMVDGFKVGSVLFTRSGPALVSELTGAGHEVFLDLKFHDTPATVAGAVAAAGDLGVWLLTVHAAGGLAMLEAARKAAERVRGRRPLLAAVTVLTSLDSAAYAEVVGPGARGLAEATRHLAHLATAAGLDGVVCAASEARELRRALGVGPLLVVPGIRPAWSTSDHKGQARTATPTEAVAAGASVLVLGRSVTAAADPRQAATRVRSEIAAALAS